MPRRRTRRGTRVRAPPPPPRLRTTSCIAAVAVASDTSSLFLFPLADEAASPDDEEAQTHTRGITGEWAALALCGEAKGRHTMMKESR